MEKLPTISIKGKEYVTVAQRVLFFNETYTNGMIETEMTFEGKTVRAKTKVTPDVDKPNRYFIGHSEENRDDGMVNKTSAVENAETSAIGRALGLMGIGIIEGIASADEMVKAGLSGDAPKAAPRPVQSATDPSLGTCQKCGAGMAVSKTTGKPYCSAKCWLTPEQKAQPMPKFDVKQSAVEDNFEAMGFTPDVPF